MNHINRLLIQQTFNVCAVSLSSSLYWQCKHLVTIWVNDNRGYSLFLVKAVCDWSWGGKESVIRRTHREWSVAPHMPSEMMVECLARVLQCAGCGREVTGEALKCLCSGKVWTRSEGEPWSKGVSRDTTECCLMFEELYVKGLCPNPGWPGNCINKKLHSREKTHVLLFIEVRHKRTMWRGADCWICKDEAW